MTSEKHKMLIKDIVNSYHRLPDIKRIKIDEISDSNADLANFLSKYIPAQLKLLLLNYDSKNITPIKMKFYTSAIAKAASLVTRDIYICHFELNEEDLQQIIRAS